MKSLKYFLVIAILVLPVLSLAANATSTEKAKNSTSTISTSTKDKDKASTSTKATSTKERDLSTSTDKVIILREVGSDKYITITPSVNSVWGRLASTTGTTTITMPVFQSKEDVLVKGNKVLANGKEVKIMPDTASTTAIEKQKLNKDVTIELKDTGKPVYDVTGIKDSRLFGIFSKKMKVTVEVDATTGEVIKVMKPWWAWLARE